jgi:hypothetical protein
MSVYQRVSCNLSLFAHYSHSGHTSTVSFPGWNPQHIRENSDVFDFSLSSEDGCVKVSRSGENPKDCLEIEMG